MSNEQSAMSNASSVGAVILAAGQGSRLGNKPKALLKAFGESLIERQLRALKDVGITDIVVVTGFHHEQIEPIVQTFGARVVRNPQPSFGQPTSVRLGMQAIGESHDAVIMMLSDQPLVDQTDIAQLLTAFRARSVGDALVPRVRGQRGNPIVVAGSLMSKMLAQSPTTYCREYLDQHPDEVSYFDCDNEHFVTDIDTLDDLDALKKRWGIELE